MTKRFSKTCSDGADVLLGQAVPETDGLQSVLIDEKPVFGELVTLVPQSQVSALYRYSINRESSYVPRRDTRSLASIALLSFCMLKLGILFE